MLDIYIISVLIVLYFVITEGWKENGGFFALADYFYIFLFGLIPVFNLVLIYFIVCHKYEVWKGKA